MSGTRPVIKIGHKFTLTSGAAHAKSRLAATNNPLFPLGCRPTGVEDSDSVLSGTYMFLSGFGEPRKELFHARLGEDLAFGSVVRIVHVASGKLVCLNTRARAESEKAHFQISLEAVTSEHAVHSRFTILPSSKVRSEGQKILSQDYCALRCASASGEWFLNISSKFPSDMDGANRILEANASHRPTSFKVSLFDMSPQSLTAFNWNVRCSEVIQLYHREGGTLVASDSVDPRPYFINAGVDLGDAADAEAASAGGGAGGDGDEEEGHETREGFYPSKSLFIVEWAEEPTIGGPVRFGRGGKMFRLRHMATGLFLALRKDTSKQLENNNNCKALDAGVDEGRNVLPWEFHMTSDGESPATRVYFHQASDDASPDMAHHSRIFMQFPLCGQWLSTEQIDVRALLRGGGGADSDEEGNNGGDNNNNNNATTTSTSGRRSGSAGSGAAPAATAASTIDTRRPMMMMPESSSDFARQHSTGRVKDPVAEAAASREQAERALQAEIAARQRLPAASNVSHSDGLEVLKVPYVEFSKLHSVVSMIAPLERLNQILGDIPLAHRGGYMSSASAAYAPPTQLVQHVRDNIAAMCVMCTRSEDPNAITRDGQPDANAQQRISDQRILHLVMDIIEKLLPVSTVQGLTGKQIDKFIAANAKQVFDVAGATDAATAAAKSSTTTLDDGANNTSAVLPAGRRVDFATTGDGNSNDSSSNALAAAAATAAAGGGRKKANSSISATQQYKLAAISFNVVQLGFRLMRQCALRNATVSTDILDLVPRIILYCANPKKKVGATAALVELFRDQLLLCDRPDDPSKLDCVIKLVHTQRRTSNQALTLLAVMSYCKRRGIPLNQSRVGEDLLYPSVVSLFPQQAAVLPPDFQSAEAKQRLEALNREPRDPEVPFDPVFFKLFLLPNSKNPAQIYVDVAEIKSSSPGAGSTFEQDPTSTNNNNNNTNEAPPASAMTLEDFLDEERKAVVPSSKASARSDGDNSSVGGAGAAQRKKLLSSQINPAGNLLQQMLLVAALCADRHEHNTQLARIMYPFPLLNAIAQNSDICGEMRAAAINVIRSIYVDVDPLADLVRTAGRPMFVWSEVVQSVEKAARSHGTAGSKEGDATDEQYFDAHECYPQLLTVQETFHLKAEKSSVTGKGVLQLVERMKAYLVTVGALNVLHRDENSFIDAAVNLARDCLRLGWIEFGDFPSWIAVLGPVLDGRNDVGPAHGWIKTDAADERNYYLVTVKISCIESFRTMATIIRNGLVRVMVRAFAAGLPPVHCCAVLDLRARSPLHSISLARKRINEKKSAAIKARAEKDPDDEGFFSCVTDLFCADAAPEDFAPPKVDTAPFQYLAEILDILFFCALYKEPSMVTATLSFLLELTNVEYALYPTLTQVQLLANSRNAAFYNEMRHISDALTVYKTSAIPISELPQLISHMKRFHSALHATLVAREEASHTITNNNNNSVNVLSDVDNDAGAMEERFFMMFHMGLHSIVGQMVVKIAAVAYTLEQQEASTSGAHEYSATKSHAHQFLDIGCAVLELFLLHKKFSKRVAKGLLPLLRDFCSNVVFHPQQFAGVVRLMLAGNYDICRAISEESMENLVYAVSQHPRMSILAHLLRIIVFQTNAQDDGEGIIERNQRQQMRLLRVLENSSSIGSLLRPGEYFMQKGGQARLHTMLGDKEYMREDSELTTRLELLLTLTSCANNRHPDARGIARHLLFGKSTQSALEQVSKMLDWEPVIGVVFTKLLQVVFLEDPGIVQVLMDNKPVLEQLLTRLHSTVSKFANDVRNGDTGTMMGGEGEEEEDQFLPAAAAHDDTGHHPHAIRERSPDHVPNRNNHNSNNNNIEPALTFTSPQAAGLRRRSRAAMNDSFEVKCYHALLCALPCVSIIATELERSNDRTSPAVLAVSAIANDVAELMEEIADDYPVMEVGDSDEEDEAADAAAAAAAPGVAKKSTTSANKDASAGAKPKRSNSGLKQQQQQQQQQHAAAAVATSAGGAPPALYEEMQPLNKKRKTYVAVGVAMDMRLPSAFFFGDDPNVDEFPVLRSIKQVPIGALRYIISVVTLGFQMRLLHEDSSHDGLQDKLCFLRSIRHTAVAASSAADEAAAAAAHVHGKSIQDEWEEFTEKFKNTAAGTKISTMMRTPARLLLRRGQAGHYAIKAVVKIVDMPQLTWYERTMYLHFLRQCVVIHPDPLSDARLILPNIADDTGEEDAALKAEKMKKMLSIDKPQSERQTIFANWKGDAQLPPKLMQLLAKTNSDDSVMSVLMCMCELLKDGHRAVQTTIMNFFLEIQNESFFASSRALLLAGREMLRDRIATIENEIVDQGLAGCTDHVITLVTPLYNFAVTTKLLRACQLMCEGQYSDMQHYLRDQWDNSVSICLLDPFIELLQELITAPRGVDFDVFELTLQVMATIVEVVQGPNRTNISYLVSQGIGSLVIRVFSSRPQHLSDEQYGELCGAMVTLLRALLEGHPDMAMLAGLVKSMSLQPLVAQMDEAWAVWEEARSGETLCHAAGKGELGFCAEMCNSAYAHGRRIYKSLFDPHDHVDPEAQRQLTLACDIFIFIKILLSNQTLNAQKAAAGAAAAATAGTAEANNSSTGTKDKSESSMLLQDRDGRTIVSLLRESKSFSKVNKMVASIEIFRNDKVEAVHFCVPRICITNLTESAKTRVVQGVDRASDESRITTFYDYCFNIMDELLVLEETRTTRVLSLFMYYASELDDLALLLAFLINLLVIGVVRWETVDTIDGSESYFVGEPTAGMAYKVLGWILFALQFSMFCNNIFGELRVYLNEAWGMWQAELNQHAVRDSKAALSVIPPHIVDDAKSELPEWQVLMWNLYFTACYFPFWKHSFFLAFALSGAITEAPYFYCPQLFVIVIKFPALFAVVKSITMNVKPLGLTFIFLLCVCYTFAVVAFFTYSDLFNESNYGLENNCETMARCFATTLWSGLRSGGGLGDMTTPPIYTSAAAWVGRIVYDLLFFIIMILLFLNLCFGIILDSFGSLREETEALQEDQESKCFICGLGVAELDQIVPGGFASHILNEQRFWNYLFFMCYLREKDESEHNGAEGYVWDKMAERDHSWFPIGRCIAADFAGGSEQEEAAANDKKEEEDAAEDALGAEREDDSGNGGGAGDGGSGGGNAELLAALKELSSSIDSRLTRLEQLVVQQAAGTAAARSTTTTTTTTTQSPLQPPLQPRAAPLSGRR